MSANNEISALCALNDDELDAVSGGNVSIVDFGSWSLIYGTTTTGKVGASVVTSDGRSSSNWVPLK